MKSKNKGFLTLYKTMGTLIYFTEYDFKIVLMQISSHYLHLRLNQSTNNTFTNGDIKCEKMSIS